MLRWQQLSRELTEADGPTVEIVKLADVADAPPALLPPHPRAVRRADHRPAALHRQKDAQLMTAPTGTTPTTNGLLQDKVVVLSGVGPGLGRALGEEAARMGADLVLVSRTERRLEKMAEMVRSLGRRALVVPTDITDEDARAPWSRLRSRSSARSTA